MKVGTVTFGGNYRILTVGKARYGLSRFHKFVHVYKGGKPLCYVLAPGGRVHVLVEAGEILPPLAEALQTKIRRHYFGLT